MPERANWFVGLAVPGAGWLDRLGPPPTAFRLFGPSDLHLTVAFLGRVDEQAARAAWASTTWRDAPRTITLGAIVPMGSPRRWSALSILLVEGRAAIEAEIGRARVATCAAAGVEVDARPPKAHVTIGRPQRRASESERSAARSWAERIELPPVTVTVDKIALYTWSEDRSSSLFRIVASAPLPRT